MPISVGITSTATGETKAVQVATTPLPQVVEGDSDQLVDFRTIALKPVGRCIYCGAKDDLTREHVIPFALNGEMVLADASCKACAAITGKFELQVLRGPMRAVRILRGLRSRKGHASSPIEYPLTIERNGVKEIVRLPIEKYPVLLHFPILAVPRALDGRSGVGVDVSGIITVSFGKNPLEVARELGARQITINSNGDQPAAFARMLAKIGYSFAVACGCDALLDGDSVVLPAILGDRDDIGDWVGMHTGPIQKYPGSLHRIAVREDVERGFLIADVQLFADAETPTYGVILGRLRAR